MAIDVGPVRGVVRRPTGSEPSAKDVLWFEQSNPSDPNDGILRFFDTRTQQWERISDKDIFTREYIEVVSDDETIFTLNAHVASGREANTTLIIRNLGMQNYGDDFTVAGNILTFIADNFSLKAGDKLDIRYAIH